jgi:hypothetical protein
MSREIKGNRLLPSGYRFYDGQYPNPLKNVISDGGDFTKPFVAGDPSLAIPDEDNFYVICCTPVQMNKIMSALEVGAPIAYPDAYSDINQLVQQAYEFPNSFGGADCMDLCAMILECINTDTDIQQAIAHYSLTSAIDGDTPENQTILDTNIVPVSVGCEFDNLFGMTRQFANFLNVLSTDILELFTNAFNALARLGDLIEAIPGIGVLPADDILQAVDAFAEQIAQAYEAAYDSQINEDIACGLFCIAQENCELTFEMARDYFDGLLTEAVSNTDFVQMFNDIIANNWLGEQGIYVMHKFILETLIFGGEILGLDANRVLTTIATLYNDPDSDWEILCTDCPSIWQHTFDFSIENDGWVARNIWGTGNCAVYTADVGWDSQDRFNGVAEYSRLVAIAKTFADTEITGLTMHFNKTESAYTTPPGGTVSSIGVQKFLDSVLVDQTIITMEDAPDGGGVTTSNLLTGTADEIRLFLRVSVKNSASYEGSCRITKLVVSGTGTNPFEA